MGNMVSGACQRTPPGCGVALENGIPMSSEFLMSDSEQTAPDS